jgi:hypothetical protein
MSPVLARSVSAAMSAITPLLKDKRKQAEVAYPSQQDERTRWIRLPLCTRPEDYSPEQGARFEIHFEKLRNRVDGVGAVLFEAKIEAFTVNDQDGIRWSCCDLKSPMLQRAAELFSEGMTVREVAATLRISKSEAGRLRIRALEDGILVPETHEAGQTIQ